MRPRRNRSPTPSNDLLDELLRESPWGNQTWERGEHHGSPWAIDLTARALAALSAPLSELNRLLDLPGKKRKKHRASVARMLGDLETVARILGVFGREPSAYLSARRGLKVARIGLDTAKVEALMQARQAARADKDWARADAAREELLALGVEVQDGPSGSTWSV